MHSVEELDPFRINSERRFQELAEICDRRAQHLSKLIAVAECAFARRSTPGWHNPAGLDRHKRALEKRRAKLQRYIALRDWAISNVLRLRQGKQVLDSACNFDIVTQSITVIVMSFLHLASLVKMPLIFESLLP